MLLLQLTWMKSNQLSFNCNFSTLQRVQYNVVFKLPNLCKKRFELEEQNLR